jgi:hypothetical protein
MKNTRSRNPTVSELLHPVPCQAVLLTPVDQRGSPEPDHPIPEYGQAVEVAGDCMVVEVALDDRPEPHAALRCGIMHTPAYLRLDFQELGPHSFAVLPANMRESQKIERLRLPFSSLGPVDFGKPPELNPARFVWVQFQPKLPQPFLEFRQETVRFGLMLKTKHMVSSPGESHPEALSEPCLNVSAHTAPATEPRRTPSCQCAHNFGSHLEILATQCVALRKCLRSFLYFRSAQRAKDRSSCRIGG